ncbi:fimbrial protein [Paraburkholderia sp. B3]|uniref:fimbrial protein n=1 Tax=Paraburkholderia sp. B3 TaxID=3134791 RepID=UPI003982080E
MNYFSNSNRKWWVFGALRSMALALLVCVPVLHARVAMAADALNCSTPVTINIPISGSITVGRDVPVGTQLTQWFTAQAWPYSTCLGTFTQYIGVGIGSAVAPTGQQVSIGGLSLPVFPTNVAGVGYVVESMSRFDYVVGGWDTGWSSYSAVPSSTTIYIVGNDWSLNPLYYNAGLGVQIAFVKTGPISPGQVTTFQVGTGTAGAAIGTGTYKTFSGSPLAPVNATGAISFTQASCTTPDVTIPLGTHLTSELKGAGTFTSAASFNININNCPAGLGTVLQPAIQYRIDPTTAVLNSAQSVVALDSTSSATGVGIQLLQSDGSTPYALSNNQTYSGYNTSTGGSYTISLQARYYQTGSTVAAGPANTSMTLTMTYY